MIMAAGDAGDVSRSYGFQEYAFICFSFVNLFTIIITVVFCITCHLWVGLLAGGACSTGKLDDLFFPFVCCSLYC